MLVILAFQLDPTAHGAILFTWTSFTDWWLPGWKAVFTGNFVVELIRSFLVALVILALGEAYTRVPKTLELLRARRFWGEGVSSDGIALCFGSLIDSRLLDHAEPSLFRYVKQFRDGRRLQIAGPSEKIIGLCEVRAGSYLINALSKFRRKPLVIEDDQTCLKTLNRSIVSIGSSASDEITEIVERDPRNRFLVIEPANGSMSIRCKLTDTVVTLEASEVRKDYGIILKLLNQRFPEQNFFVCAGLGEWGTSGAAWYLATHWRSLDALGGEFGCVVEVEIGSDQSARVIYDPTIAEAKRGSREVKHIRELFQSASGLDTRP